MKIYTLPLVSICLLSFLQSGCNESKNSAGAIRDTRDGKTYKTVKIGSQVWMAENLNYESSGSFCEGNKPENCEDYGRLYTWSVAGYVCPDGWHLPSFEEWQTLIMATGGASKARKALKSTSGWYEGLDGSDSYGFAAYPAGYAGNYRDELFFVDDDGGYAHFWCATEFFSDRESEESRAYVMELSYSDAVLLDVYKSYAFSIRCVKD